MKKTVSIVVLLGLWTAAIFAWGQVQRQPLPMASRPADDTKQEIARLRAEVDRLTKVIKVTDSSVRIEAGLIQLEGKVVMNKEDANRHVEIRSNAFLYGNLYLYGKPYGPQSEWGVI